MGVAGAGDADPRGVVEVSLAVDRLDPRALAALDDEVGVSAPDRWHAASQIEPGLSIGLQPGLFLRLCSPGQKVGGVLIHSRCVSWLAWLRQRCGSVDGKVRASPSSSR